MYERFTDRARKVMQFSNQEAQRFNHEYIATEHVLLGLIKEGSGIAANVLRLMNVDLTILRNEMMKHVQPGPDMITMGKLPFTPRVKKIVEHAINEAHNLGHNYVGTEHLLLGVLGEPDGTAFKMLTGLGITADEVRAAVRHMMKGEPQSESGAVIGLAKFVANVEEIKRLATDDQPGMTSVDRLAKIAALAKEITGG